MQTMHTRLGACKDGKSSIVGGGIDMVALDPKGAQWNGSSTGTTLWGCPWARTAEWRARRGGGWRGWWRLRY